VESKLYSVTHSQDLTDFMASWAFESRCTSCQHERTKSMKIGRAAPSA